jgi:nucleoside-diphosphate-sugar epimerase
MNKIDLRAKYDKKSGFCWTGSSGYIGEKLSNALGGNSIAISADDIPEESVLIHLAAEVSPLNISTLQNNIAIDLQTLQLAKTKNLKVIYASGNNVYPKSLNCDISTLPEASDYYAASKIAGESLLISAQLQNWSILRIGDVFGPDQRHGNLFKAIAKSIQNGSPLQLSGKGLKVRSYIYIDELISIFIHLAKLIKANEANNLLVNTCFEKGISVYEIISYIGESTGLPVEHKELENDFSDKDLRTMIQTPIKGYSYKLDMNKALDTYVRIMSQSYMASRQAK